MPPINEHLKLSLKRAGKEGVVEYLQHIKNDYEQTRINKLIKKLKRIKF